MGASFVILPSIIVFIIAYFTYGSYVAKRLGVDDTRKTPAHTRSDGVDYSPAKAPVLLGHHFASIAGAAPIIGPVVAASFGWVPVVLWLVIGGVFLGSVHDFAALIASVRHDGQSIGKVIEDNIGKSGKYLFLLFSWSALILVVAVFTFVVAKTFATVPSSASSSIFFIFLAVLFGVTIYRWNFSLTAATVAAVCILFLCILLGLAFPVKLSIDTWIIILLAYIFVASVTPVWVLLQPRDYLNSFLLYAAMIFSVYGIIAINPQIELPAITSFKIDELGYIFPALFVTVACGAISGFHSLVASGTTSKQLDKESDAKLIGYGSMLIESLLGVVAIITAAVLTMGSYKELLAAKGPISVFSQGVGGFMTALHIPMNVGTNFAALTVSAFALTSLDTASRLARYTFQEVFYKDGVETQSVLYSNKFIATGITVISGGALAMTGKWKIIWPLFGAANQLLATIALLAVCAWLTGQKKKTMFIKIPMFFMFVVTTTALCFLIHKNLLSHNYLLAVMAVLLFILAVVLLWQGYVANRKVPESF